MQHKGTLTIETPRLILRRFSHDDAQCVHDNWMGDERITPYVTWQPTEDVSATQWVLDTWIAAYPSRTFYLWAIELRELGQPVGKISVTDRYDELGIVRIGCCIGADWWRRSIASEALTAIIRFFFDQVGANRIEAWHDIKNPNSGGVLRNCGMQFEGVMRRSDMNNRGVADMAMYSILAEDHSDDGKLWKIRWKIGDNPQSFLFSPGIM